MKTQNEIKKAIGLLTEKIHDQIHSSSTKELTNGSNGYPEPYAGVLLRVDDLEELETIENFKDEIEAEIKAITSSYEEMEDGEEKEELESIINNLEQIEISFASAEWNDGWSFARPHDIHSIETVTNEKLFSAFLVSEISDLENISDLEDAMDTLGIADQINLLAKQHDVEPIDVITNGKYRECVGINFDGVLVQKLIRDNPKGDSEYEIENFDTIEEANEWLKEEVVECEMNYDNKNFAVGLRIFGFTSDLHDLLQEGGGMCSIDGRPALSELNIPKYKS